MRFLRGLYGSFAVQLFLLHLRGHVLLLLVWALLVLMISGGLGAKLGIQYLFLDAEYLGAGGFGAFVHLGLAFGFFTMNWNLSTYLLVGRHFSFLASLARPFFKFCVNNALLPLGVLAYYMSQLVVFWWPSGWAAVAEPLSGLLLGVTLSIFLYAIYFNVTNRDISYYLPGRRLTPPNAGPADAARRGDPAALPHPVRHNPYRVRTYLGARLTVALVRSVRHYDGSVLSSIFRQNHLNAILIQLLTILFLAALGLLIDYPAFQIPAGASFLVLFSLIVSVIGAVSYWFAEWRMVLLLLLFAAFNLLTRSPFFQYGSRAYGLDYTARAPYAPAAFREVYGSPGLADDVAATEAILDRWKARQPEPRPPLVVVCASGGGLTAAAWTTHLLQQLQQSTRHGFLRRTALMTGASGGMLGLAYLREAYLRDSTFADRGSYYTDRISQDLLNPVAFSIVSNDLFLPLTHVTVNGRSYRRDRGYGFERELDQHTAGWLDKPLADYRAPESAGRIPLLFVTPSIVEDGRRLLVSPQGTTYMTAPPAATRDELPLRADLVDFRRLLGPARADSLRFLSALRMNATYPYVLPLVELPTEPTVRVMDAGYRDNYGVVSAIRFLSVFRDWIAANTSGVHLVRINAFSREDSVRVGGPRGIADNLLSPVGVAGNILGVQVLDQDVLLARAAADFPPGFFSVHRLDYRFPDDEGTPSSISLHLTTRERRLVQLATDRPATRAALTRLVRELSPPPINPDN